MDEKSRKIPDGIIIDSVRIAYHGDDAKEMANDLRCELLDQLGWRVGPPMDVPSEIPALGIAALFIEIIVTFVVENALKMLLSQIISFAKRAKIMIILKRDEHDPGRRINLGPKTDQEQVLKIVDKYMEISENMSLAELLEIMRKFNDEIRSLFQKAVTLLDIGVVSSEDLVGNEPDLMVSGYSFEQCHKYVEEKVAEANGKVLTGTRDEIVAWFASPSDAVNCALDIFDGRDDFNETRNILKDPFQFRIGISSGLALIDEKNAESFAGTTLNIANHLQKEAEPGSFLISENTYEGLVQKDQFGKSKYIERCKVLSYAFIQG